MRTHWVLFMAQGVVMLILGVIAVIWPHISTVAADIYIGWIFLRSGLVAMFWAPSMPGFLWSMLTEALTLIAGVLLLWHPVAGVVSLTLVLAPSSSSKGSFRSRLRSGIVMRSLTHGDGW